MKPTVYLETSVISYYVSRPSRDLIVAAHQQVTHDWWADVLPKCAPHISVVVLNEIARGDTVAVGRRQMAVDGMPILGMSDEVQTLAAQYAAKIELPEACRSDSLHLALATLHGFDYLATWNCRHIASGRVLWIVEEVNDRWGVETPKICTPEELMEL
jgi:hypothetical protein